jgi:hypothetical protein
LSSPGTRRTTRLQRAVSLGAFQELAPAYYETFADPHGKRIFWLCGKAGIGKSTISRTIAEDLDKEGRLGASFFFKRGRADRSHATLFFPTVAKQLADKLPGLGHAIAAALDCDSLLSEKYMTKQFDELLLRPLRNNVSCNAFPKDCFLVVDALDECEKPEQMETLLKLLKQIEDVLAARIRIFVTSRPDPPLVAGFRDMKAGSNNLLYDVQLEEAQIGSIEPDLEIFFRHELAQIRQQYPRLNPFGSLPEDWAKQQDIDFLVQRSNPLFIVAFTLCKLLSSTNKPQADLHALLSHTDGHGLSNALESVYIPVLRQAVTTAPGQSAQDKASTLRKVVGSLILLYDPLSATALSKLLDMSIEDVGVLIPPLQSVLNVARRTDGTLDPLGQIRIFHLSLRDFLVDLNLAKHDEGKAFWIEESQGHSLLTSHCLRLLSNGTLIEDMCNVKAWGRRRASVSRTEVAKHLPKEVAYACCYWVQHAVMSKAMIKDDSAIFRFLQKHMLHWMEALSWLGKTSDIIHNIAALRFVVDVSHTPIPARGSTCLLMM